MYSVRLIGWGVVVYAVVQFAWRLLSVYGFTGSTEGNIALTVVILAVSASASLGAKVQSFREAAVCACGLVLTVAFFDWILYYPFYGPVMYASVSLWLGYLAVAVPPFVMALIRSRQATPSVS